MSIRFRKDRNKWERSIVVEGKRKRLQFTTKSEALNYCLEERSEETTSTQGTISIEDAIHFYYDKVSKSKSKTSSKNECLYWNIMGPFLINNEKLKYLDQVRYSHMVAFQNFLSQPFTHEGKLRRWKPATVNRAFNSIKDFFVFYVRDGKIPASPCAHLKRIECEDHTRKPMSLEHFKAAIQKAPDWFKPAMLFIYLTASAPSSVARLKWDDVSFEDRQIIITRRKGKKSAFRKIPQPMTDAIYELLKALPVNHAYVFSNEHGKPLSADWCSDMGNRAIRAAGLPKETVLYCMRHSMASDLADANVNMDVIRQIMGHSNIRTTQRYSKPKTETLASAIRLVREPKMPPKCHQEGETVAHRWQAVKG